ncbi:MAG: Na/Pi cotransporter family protein [Oscillospiraceae bacterium]|nr:Na/Pi cotransporter family protein [Oscillospiraceae bacterium]
MTIANILQLAGGIGIFLYGMKLMGEGLENAAGDRLKGLLNIITGNRFLALLVGIAFTAVVQSSSATTAMVVGFVNAGLINLTQAVSVIMGADIGTTVTSIIISLNLNSIAPLAVFIGVALLLFGKKQILKHIGEIITGFGLLFMGINYMSDSMEPLKTSAVFHNFITNNSNPFVGVLIGLVITTIIQSSSASVGILQAIAMQGLVPIGFSAYVILGQNIGAVMPTLLSSVGTKVNAKRAAFFRLLFNCTGVIIFFLITRFTPYVHLIEKLTDNPVLQISLLHIIFNAGSVLILMPFSSKFIKLTELIIKDKQGEDEALKLRFIDDRILQTPPMAVIQSGRETERMARIARDNFVAAAEALMTGNLGKAESIRHGEEKINFLNNEITDYLIKINKLDLSDKDAEFIGTLYHTVNDIERIGDHAMNILEAAEQAVNKKKKFPDDVVRDIDVILQTVTQLLDGAINVLKNQKVNKEEFLRLNDIEEKVDELTGLYNKKHIERLKEHAYSTETGMLFINTIIDFERVGDHAINIGGSLLDKSIVI